MPRRPLQTRCPSAVRRQRRARARLRERRGGVGWSQPTLRVAGGLPVGVGAANMVSPFTPMHTREVLAAGGGTGTDKAHLAVVAGTTLQIMGPWGRGRRLWQGVPALLRCVAGDDAGGRQVDRNAEERGRSEPADAVGWGVGAHFDRRLPAVDVGASGCPRARQRPHPNSRPGGVSVGKRCSWFGSRVRASPRRAGLDGRRPRADGCWPRSRPPGRRDRGHHRQPVQATPASPLAPAGCPSAHPRGVHPGRARWRNPPEAEWRLFRRAALAGQSFARSDEITLAIEVAPAS